MTVPPSSLGHRGLVVSIFTRGAPVYWVCAHWLKVVIHACRVICGDALARAGMEHLPQTEKGAVILLPKHQSTWETFFFPMLMSHPLAYVFKRELLYIPFFGWARIGRCDMIHIDRRKRTEACPRRARQAPVGPGHLGHVPRGRASRAARRATTSPAARDSRSPQACRWCRLR